MPQSDGPVLTNVDFLTFFSCRIFPPHLFLSRYIYLLFTTLPHFIFCPHSSLPSCSISTEEFLSRRVLPLRKHPFCHHVFPDYKQRGNFMLLCNKWMGVGECIGTISVPLNDIVITPWATETECTVTWWRHGKLVLAEDQWYNFCRLLANWKISHMRSIEYLLVTNWSHLVNLCSEFLWYYRKHDLSSSYPHLFTVTTPGSSVKGWQMRHMLL